MKETITKNKFRPVKITHIDTMRTEKLCSRIAVIQHFKIDEFAYGAIVYNEGIHFLNTLYKGFAETYISKFETNKGFWNWWKLQWANTERAVLQDYYNEKLEANIDHFKEDMQHMMRRNITISGFNNFLKVSDVEL